MSYIPQLTKACVTIPVGGKRITLSPFSFKDTGDFELWLQYRTYQQVKRIGAEPDAVREVLNECIKTPPTKEQTNVAMNSPEGLSYMLYLSAKHKHPDMDEDFFASLPIGELHEAMDVLNALSQGGVSNPSKARKASKKNQT